jgi:hypothetical protein
MTSQGIALPDRTEPEREPDMENKADRLEIVIIDVRFKKWLRRIASVMGIVIVPIGIGIAVDSAAMQWIGFILSFLFLALLARENKKETSFSTPAAAIAYLESLERSRRDI